MARSPKLQRLQSARRGSFLPALSAAKLGDVPRSNRGSMLPVRALQSRVPHAPLQACQMFGWRPRSDSIAEVRGRNHSLVGSHLAQESLYLAFGTLCTLPANTADWCTHKVSPVLLALIERTRYACEAAEETLHVARLTKLNTCNPLDLAILGVLSAARHRS